MAITTFDTLKFVRRLEEAGVPSKQAEVQAEVLTEAFNVNLESLVTKDNMDTRFAEQQSYMHTRFAEQRSYMPPVVGSSPVRCTKMKWLVLKNGPFFLRKYFVNTNFLVFVVAILR